MQHTLNFYCFSTKQNQYHTKLNLNKLCGISVLELFLKAFENSLTYHNNFLLNIPELLIWKQLYLLHLSMGVLVSYLLFVLLKQNGKFLTEEPFMPLLFPTVCT